MSWIIARKELRSLFLSPIACVVLALFGLGVALSVSRQLTPGAQATLQPTLIFCVLWMMTFMVPALSMGLVSGELRSGTLEKLMTSPLGDHQIILGKWLGAQCFLATLLIPLLLAWGALEGCANPDPGPILCGLIGLLLMGGAQLAIGLFCSTLSSNQVVALLLTIAILAIPGIGLAPLVDDPALAPKWRLLVDYVSTELRYRDFARGVIDLTHIAWFVSITVLFLFLATLSLHSRRWR